MSVDLTNPIFHNEDAARAYFEASAGPTASRSARIAALSNEATSSRASRIAPACISATPAESSSR